MSSASRSHHSWLVNLPAVEARAMLSPWNITSSRTSQLPCGKLTDYTEPSHRMRCFISTGLHTFSWHSWPPFMPYSCECHCLWAFSSKNKLGGIHSHPERAESCSQEHWPPGNSGIACSGTHAYFRKQKVLWMQGAAACGEETLVCPEVVKA